jgi:hypothetical protein
MVRSRLWSTLGTSCGLTAFLLGASCTTRDSHDTAPANAGAPSVAPEGAGAGGVSSALAGSGGARHDADAQGADSEPVMQAPAADDDSLGAAVGDAASPSASSEDAGSSIPARTGVAGKLCDREPGITFAAVIGPGTEIQSAGSYFMTENGTLFLAVEGDCRFWVQPGRFDPAFTGILGDAEIARLIELFQLESWQGSVSASIGGAGTPNTWLILGRVDPRPACVPAGPSVECSELPWRTSAGIEHSMVLQGLRLAVEELRAVGTPVGGDLRYLLTAGQQSLPEHDWSKPGAWPLGDPDDHVFPQPGEDDAYRPGLSRLASGDDARALRELWQRLLAYEISGRDPDRGPSSAAAIPIEHDGMRYELFVRDSLPIEDAMGRIAF